MNDNAKRFDGLAAIYAAQRPTYPREIMAALAEAVMGRDLPNTALDVGCGTGISTAALADALPGWTIVGVEPNGDMRGEAERHYAGLSDVRFANHGAEDLPAADRSAGLVLAAQALHWFDRPAFYAEAARVLPKGGVLAVLYNNRRNDDSDLLCEIEDYLESLNPDYSRDYRKRDVTAELKTLDDFEDVARTVHAWAKPSSPDDMADYFLSRSMIKPMAAKVGAETLRNTIRGMAEKVAGTGPLAVPFAAELDIAIRK